ncbi:AzlD domain-containing protein (plasmid) [Natrinema zhouii]|uniref:AzlD domain-containing protein n=1 Tax=Natrinema zhouii TaxID=1710539 RepID=UPI001D000493|nr:AzlD domain-containing protein [Natrinema zhouii]UHQ98964.1 AzlD domain-containing protein [Natrinema zhouii]
MSEFSTLAIWAIILVIAVATYLIRLSFIHLFGRINRVPPRISLFLRFVPAAVLAALVAPGLVTPNPDVAAMVADERLVAGIVAAAVAWWRENILLTIVAGMATLWVLEFGPALVF